MCHNDVMKTLLCDPVASSVEVTVFEYLNVHCWFLSYHGKSENQEITGKLGNCLTGRKLCINLPGITSLCMCLCPCSM